MKNTLLCPFLALLCSCATTTPHVAAPPFEPALVSISVADMETSFSWYRDVLGFTLVRRYDFPEDGLVIVFAVRDGFELELVGKDDSVAFDAPIPGNPASRQGFGKIAFEVEDLEPFAKAAAEAGIEPINAIGRSNRTGGCFTILSDPDGHWIQLYGPCPPE